MCSNHKNTISTKKIKEVEMIAGNLVQKMKKY